MTNKNGPSPEIVSAANGASLKERTAAYIAAAEFLNEDIDSRDPRHTIDIVLGISTPIELDAALVDAYATNPKMANAFWGRCQNPENEGIEPVPEPLESIHARKKDELDKLRKEHSPLRKLLGKLSLHPETRFA